MGSYVVVRRGRDGAALQVGRLVVFRDGTGLLTLRMPIRGELQVKPAEIEDDEPTRPGRRIRSRR